MNEQEKSLYKDFKNYDDQCGSMFNWKQCKKETFSAYNVDTFDQLVIRNFQAAENLVGFGMVCANSDELD